MSQMIVVLAIADEKVLQLPGYTPTWSTAEAAAARARSAHEPVPLSSRRHAETFFTAEPSAPGFFRRSLRRLTP